MRATQWPLVDRARAPSQDSIVAEVMHAVHANRRIGTAAFVFGAIPDLTRPKHSKQGGRVSHLQKLAALRVCVALWPALMVTNYRWSE